MEVIKKYLNWYERYCFLIFFSSGWESGSGKRIMVFDGYFFLVRGFEGAEQSEEIEFFDVDF